MENKQKEIISPLRQERKENEDILKERRDYYTVVTFCQTVIAIVLFVILFFTAKGNTDKSAALKADFSNLMSWSIDNTNAESVMKMINSYLKEPVDLMPAFSPKVEETFITEETTVSVLTEETTVSEKETVADTEGNTENMGGQELEKSKEESREVSTVALLKSAVHPVNSTNYTSYYGERVSPITGENSFHTGLDIAAPMGEDVMASYSGRVKKTGEDERNGKYVVIKHSDKTETVYCHLSEILTEKGDKVFSGEVIGLVGSTGWSTGPHLHFEIRKDGKSIDPLTVLKNDV